jgi:hypothetical protein
MGVSGGPDMIQDGLVLALNAADRTSYISGSNIWFDLTPNSNNGTLINGPTFSPANGGSIVFDGIDDHVNIQNSEFVNPGLGSFTVICWVNSDPSNAGDGWDLWVAKRSSGTNGYYIGANNPLGVRFMLGNNVESRTDTGFIGYTFNTWAMFTAILNRADNTQTIVRNAYEESSTVTPSGGNYYNTTNLYLGADVGLGAFYVNGRQSSVYIYNRALSQSEVIQNYNSQKTRYNL